ncbi:MAG: M20/M25/M40 family metallo-hydrolase [Acidobacteriota bacterium]
MSFPSLRFAASNRDKTASKPLRRRPSALLAAACLLLPATAQAEEPLDWQVVNQIREEGFRRSQVTETARYLTQEIGPRLTGSPANREAFEWTRDRLSEWGLENARLEPFEFGHGWTFDRAAVHMIVPHSVPLSALPNAWTPGTEGPVRGTAMRLEIKTRQDLEKHKGKLAGKILFVDEAGEPTERENEPMKRWTPEELHETCGYIIPRDREFNAWRARFKKRYALREELKKFLVEEGVVAVVENSSRGHGVLRLTGGGSGGDPQRHRGIPELTMIQEHYNRVLRLLEDEHEVELEIDISAHFHEDDPIVHNTLAEIPGTERPEEIVLIGAHLDSWHAGTGATDNGAGSVIMMEAMRILKAIGVEPKRTIRIALWNGEEQGLRGARAHVEEHYADRPEPSEEQKKLPRILRERTWPIQPKEDYDRFVVYFNIDNGGGKVRGVYSQDNAAAVPVFKRWLEPFGDLGADTVTANRTGGTDHLAFDEVGLPGFQFIQDPLDYMSRTHHTHIDTFEHLVPEDLKQASVVVASFAYHAANRAELFPRKPMPQKPHESERARRKREKAEAERKKAEAEKEKKKAEAAEEKAEAE